VINLEAAEWVASGDLLSVNIGDTEVSLGFLLGVDNGHDSESVVDTELSAVAPRHVDGRAASAGDVEPRLGGSILDIKSDHSARLNRAVVARSEVEVVVAARLVLGTVAAQVLDGPGQAVGNGLAAGRGSGGYGGDSAGSSLGGRSRGSKSEGTVGRDASTVRVGVCRVAGVGGGGRRCRGRKSEGTVGRDA